MKPGHARALAVVGVLVVLVAVSTWLFEPGAIERARVKVPADGESSTTLEAPLTTGGATESDARARIDDTRLAPTTWRFDELVFVRSSATDAPIAFDVQSYTSDGIRRAARGDDVVLGRDVEPGGVWILSAPGHCPAWVAPEAIVDMAALGGERPYFPLFPSATVVVRSHDGAPLSATIDWIELTPTGDPRVLAQHANGEHSVSSDFAVVDEGAVQRELFAGVDDVARATQHVRTLREALQREIDAESARHSLDRTTRVTAMTLAHGRDPWANVVAYPPFGERVVIEHVPAGTFVSVRAGCAHMLDFELLGARRIRSRHAQSIAETEGFELAQGEVLELRVRSVRSASVRVQQPAAVTRAPQFDFQRIADPEGSGLAPTEARGARAGEEKRAPTRSADGAFEWSELPAGTYTLSATWVEAPDFYASAVHTFDLDEGEERDLGVLVPYPTGCITLVPRLVAAEGAALPAVDLTALVVRVSLDGTDGPGAGTRSFNVVHGRPIVVAGLAPGEYTLRIVAVERANHGALIVNAGDLTGADLIEALRRDLEASAVRLAESAAPIAVTVEGHTRVDVEVPIERSAP